VVPRFTRISGNLIASRTAIPAPPGLGETASPTIWAARLGVALPNAGEETGWGRTHQGNFGHAENRFSAKQGWSWTRRTGRQKSNHWPIMTGYGLLDHLFTGEGR